MPVKKNRKAFSRELDRETDRILNQSGIVIQNAMKSEIVRMGVVDTGRTLSSVEYETEQTPDGGTVRIGTRLKYAIHPHNGTRYVEPRPWAITGTNKARPQLQKIWSD